MGDRNVASKLHQKLIPSEIVTRRPGDGKDSFWEPLSLAKQGEETWWMKGSRQVPRDVAKSTTDDPYEDDALFGMFTRMN